MAIVRGVIYHDLVPLRDAARILGVGAEQVRRYVHRGILPAEKIGNVWLTGAAHVRGLRFAPPRCGRPLAPQAAWASILVGDIDIDDPWRHANRGEITRWHANGDQVADLLRRPDVIVSGVHAAQVHGALLDPVPDEAQVYVTAATDAGGAELLEGLTRSGFGSLLVRCVDPAAWPQLREAATLAPDPGRLQFGSSATRYAPPPLVALDLAVSPHPREQDHAEAIARSLP